MKILPFILISVLFLFSCSGKQESAEHSCCSKPNNESRAATLPGESVYNLESTWTSQDNQAMQLKDFGGKTVIAAMVFTHCESACPRIVADMQRLESQLTEKELEKITFLLISMDPDRDTTSRLKQFAREHKLNANWTLVRSDEAATVEIANVLGVKVKKLEEGGFDHSNLIHILNRTGVITHQQLGFATEQKEELEAIRSTLLWE